MLNRVPNLEKGDGIRNALYTTSNGTKPPEINWTAVGPVLQKHVEDLQRLQDLNEMTSKVVNRIRNITQLGDSATGNGFKFFGKCISHYNLFKNY